MRLTDTEELINILEWNRGQEKDALVSINSLIKLIKERPTAYDVDKVVKELERLKETEQNREDECDEEGNGDAEQIFSDGESQGKFRAYLKAIEVVKAGGINNNVSKKM